MQVLVANERVPFFYVIEEPLRLMYVDDDPILREFAVVHLTTETASVTTAEDGLAALELIRACPPDLVLLDLEMPRMDGFECLRRIRDDAEMAHTPVIVATSREDVGAVDRAFQDGATSFVIKPINWRLLSHQIRYIYRTHHAATLLAAREAQAREALHRACDAGSRFLSKALAAHPSLAGDAHEYLDALEQGASHVGRNVA